MLRRLLGPDLLSMLCVVAVSAVSIVGVWKVRHESEPQLLICCVFFFGNESRCLPLTEHLHHASRLALTIIGKVITQPPPKSLVWQPAVCAKITNDDALSFATNEPGRVKWRVYLFDLFSQIGGRPGLATLVMAVCVGLFVQNWDRALDLLNLGLELVGVRLDGVQPTYSGGRKCWVRCGAELLTISLLTPSLTIPY